MTRAQYIEAVKVKLEEISPFDEPATFIAAGDSEINSIKPIVSYIDNTLDEATKNCLLALPLSLLHPDIEAVPKLKGGSEDDLTVAVDSQGVGRCKPVQNFRFVRFRHSTLQRDITAFITSEDPMYLLQQNIYTRGGTAKPVAVWNAATDEMEIYSFPASVCDSTLTDAVLLGVRTNKKPNSDAVGTEVVQSAIQDFIVLECAAMVADILGDTNTAQMMRSQQQQKLASVLS